MNPKIIRFIHRLVYLHPGIKSREIREKLIKQNVVTRRSAPSAQEIAKICQMNPDIINVRQQTKMIFGFKLSYKWEFSKYAEG